MWVKAGLEQQGERNKTAGKKMRIKCDVVRLKTAVMSIKAVLCSSDRRCPPDITHAGHGWNANKGA